MKNLRKLTTIYTIGLGFLAIIILVSSLSFKDTHTSIAKIAELAETLAARQTDMSPSESHQLFRLIDEIQLTRTRSYIFFTISLIVALMGVLYIIYTYRKNIVVPLRKITSATQKMAQGHFEKLPVISGTEIGMLSENFNSMGQTLDNKLRELEGSVSREQNAVRTLCIINELNSSVTHKQKINEILEAIIASGTILIKSEVIAIILIDRLNHHITHFSLSPSRENADVRTLARNIIHELINKKMPIRLSVSSEDNTFRNITENMNMKTNNFLAVPVMIEGEILGGLIFINKAGVDEFTMENEDHALMVSSQAAMAIEKSLFHEEILQLARTDGLTGLNNHRTFHEELDVELKRARRFSNHLSLLLIDIDFFKKYNDTYGHQGGDTALKDLAAIFKKNLRGIDSAARYGGEEFTVILPETTLNGALKTAERIREETGLHPFMMSARETYLTVSIGVSVFPEDAMNKEDLIKTADDALYMAKRLGRNKVVSFQQYKAERTKN